jgi:hypothetical protein
MLYRSAIVFLIAASVACSRTNDRAVAALPTGPSSTALSADGQILFVGGVSGPMDVLFPSRADSFVFRTDLENKYQQMGRSLTSTYVDKEGEIVWTQEYIRYRVNGCDHATAVQRVMTQIDGGAAGGVCSAPPEGLVLFPPRQDSLEFRRQLETKYQQMGRGLSQTYVDQEGSVIWTQEYLRYRANGCDHITAEQKVFSQIDGGPVPDVCRIPCAVSVSSSRAVFGYTAGSGSFEVRPNQADCNIGWTATSDASWLTFASTQSPGSGYTPAFAFSVAQNMGGGTRVGHITINYSGGSSVYTVEQEGSPFIVGFTMTDPFRSGTESTTECHFRSAATPCTFTAFANLPGGTYTYAWTVTYAYGTTKTTTGTASTFTITDGCGGTGAAADGPSVDLDVTLTITDNLGNTVTVRSGQGGSPALVARLFTC